MKEQFNIDDILAEISLYDVEESPRKKPAPKPNPKPVSPSPKPVSPSPKPASPKPVEPEADELSLSALIQQTRRFPIPEFDKLETESPVSTPDIKSIEPAKEPELPILPEQPAPIREEKPVEPPVRRREKAAPPPPVKAAAIAAEEQEDGEKGFRRIHGALRFILGLVFLAVTVAVIGWSSVRLSLDHGAANTIAASAKTSADIFSKLDAFVNNSAADALSDLTFIRKVYSLPYNTTVAPAPNPAGFGKVSVENAAEVLNVIEKARKSGLLDGQDVIFDTNVNFYWDSDIEYYYDETILVITWKEQIDNRVTSCVEVKIADGSQIRRKLVNDTFGDPSWVYNSELSASCNAVVSMNADFYAFRNLGICVYQGDVYRYLDRNNNTAELDILYIDNNGDFITQKRGTFEGRDATQQWAWDNAIQFSLAFGPVIVENGEPIHVVDGYNGLGEMNLEYSRAAIGQFDKLHYLFVTVNHSNESTPRANIVQFADLVASKGVHTAYNLDGGQTSEIYFQGDMYNHVDWGNERTVSDILYFATALPEDQR